jgi:hypothetical protein
MELGNINFTRSDDLAPIRRVSYSSSNKGGIKNIQGSDNCLMEVVTFNRNSDNLSVFSTMNA